MSARLVVEVDGGQHFTEEGLAADANRDAWLSSQGFRILRFSNTHVLKNLDGVLTTIAHAFATPPPLTPPHKGEGDEAAIEPRHA